MNYGYTLRIGLTRIGLGLKGRFVENDIYSVFFFFPSSGFEVVNDVGFGGDVGDMVARLPPATTGFLALGYSVFDFVNANVDPASSCGFWYIL